MRQPQLVRALILAASAGAVALAACTDVGTDPQSVVSIVNDTTVVTSVIAGDTLRDTTGAPLSLTRLGHAFNGRGDSLPSPRVDLIVTTFDSAGQTTPPATLVYGADSVAYLIAPPSFTRTSAVAVSLQYSRTLRLTHRFEIVPRADLIVLDTASSRLLTFSDATTPSGPAVFGARVSYDSLGTRRPVRATLVKFTIVSAPEKGARIDSVRFTESAGRDSLRLGKTVRFDTTDTSGLASRTLTVFRKTGAARGANGRDTIVVSADVVAGRKPFASLPIVFSVLDSVTASGTPAASRAARRP